MVNQMMYDATLRAKVQQTVPCSQAASMQRGGRAGRDSPGVCVCAPSDSSRVGQHATKRSTSTTYG